MDEIEAADSQIRAAQAKIDDLHVGLCGTAIVILQRLDRQLARCSSTITDLSDIKAGWAVTARDQLKDIIEASVITRGERHAHLLLSLPENTENAISDWVRDMRLGETNSDALIEACRYGLNRLRRLQEVKQKVANGSFGDTVRTGESMRFYA